MGDGVVVDVVLHVAGQAPAVKLLGVLQEAQPGAPQAAAHEAALLPYGLFPGGVARVLLQAAHSPAQGMGGVPQGQKALHHADDGHHGNGGIDKIVAQVGQEILRGFQHITHGAVLLGGLMMVHGNACPGTGGGKQECVTVL